MKVFLLAIFSFIVSCTVSDAYVTEGWKCYISLALVDLSFMFIFGLVDIDLKRKRWISIGLFTTVCASLVLTMTAYVYYHYDFQFIDSIALNMQDMYTSFSLSVSILIILVALLPKGILRRFDDRFWPDSLAFVYSCNISSGTKAVKEIAQRCR